MSKQNRKKGFFEWLLGDSNDPLSKLTREREERRDRTPKRATHEGASQKIRNALEHRGWDNEKKSSFHDYLNNYYPGSKETLSQTELNNIADEFDRQYVSKPRTSGRR